MKKPPGVQTGYIVPFIARLCKGKNCFPAVTDCDTVTVRPEAGGRRALRGYLVPNAGCPPRVQPEASFKPGSLDDMASEINGNVQDRLCRAFGDLLLRCDDVLYKAAVDHELNQGLRNGYGIGQPDFCGPTRQNLTRSNRLEVLENLLQDMV